MALPNEFRLAQLTDVHLGPLPVFWPWHWNAKRWTGYINFWTKRRNFNDPRLVNALVDDLKAQSFDHIAVTGDLANLGMPAEFIQCLDWLKALGSPEEVSAIPGNHDIYARLRRDPGVERWRDYMKARGSSDVVEGLPGALEASGFPFVRLFGRFALINLNSAVPTPPAVASGELGEEQINRFAAQSKALHEAGYARIVAVHHPPLEEHGPRGLRDRRIFERVLLDTGAEAVLHGHYHRGMLSWRDTATGPVPVIGAGAAGEGVYNIYNFKLREDGRCTTDISVRVGSGLGRNFEWKETMSLDPAAHPGAVRMMSTD